MTQFFNIELYQESSEIVTQSDVDRIYFCTHEETLACFLISSCVGSFWLWARICNSSDTVNISHSRISKEEKVVKDFFSHQLSPSLRLGRKKLKCKFKSL